SLSLSDLAALGRHLEPIALKERAIVQEPRRLVEYVYFIESGAISSRIVSDGGILETSVIGHQGAVGVPSLLGGHLPVYQSVVLFPGTALRAPVERLKHMMNDRPQLLEQLSRYVQAFMFHNTQAAFCGVLHTCEQRLASWLCLTSDAMATVHIPVTHDYL